MVERVCIDYEPDNLDGVDLKLFISKLDALEYKAKLEKLDGSYLYTIKNCGNCYSIREINAYTIDNHVIYKDQILYDINNNKVQVLEFGWKRFKTYTNKTCDLPCIRIKLLHSGEIIWVAFEDAYNKFSSKEFTVLSRYTYEITDRKDSCTGYIALKVLITIVFTMVLIILGHYTDKFYICFILSIINIIINGLQILYIRKFIIDIQKYLYSGRIEE